MCGLCNIKLGEFATYGQRVVQVPFGIFPVGCLCVKWFLSGNSITKYTEGHPYVRTQKGPLDLMVSIGFLVTCVTGQPNIRRFLVVQNFFLSWKLST